jgi:DNA-binding NarL/FixJ family response regulator
MSTPQGTNRGGTVVAGGGGSSGGGGAPSPIGGGVTLAEVGAAMAAKPYARRGVSASGETIRVVLADDHTIVRSGLKALLRTAPDIIIAGEASSGEEAIAVALRTDADVVVMDLDMPGMGGAAATRALARQAPNVRVLILTMHTEQERLLPLLADGARGYLGKDTAERDLIDAIRVVAGGDVYVRPAVARRLAASETVKPTPVVSEAVRGSVSNYEALSERERTVLRLVAEGYNGPEIGERLGITAKTVDTYKQRIEDKIGLTHRTDYVRFAVNWGLLGDVAAAS